MAGGEGYFFEGTMQSFIFKAYTLLEALHRLERGTLGCRWGVCWPDLGGVSAGVIVG